MSNNSISLPLQRDAVALKLASDLTFDAWGELGNRLAAMDRKLNWWIGDWWAAGQHRYGERAKVAAEDIFGKEIQTLMNIGSICRSFETSRRREVLSFKHHAEVSGLPPDQADKLLDRAEVERLSTRELRREVLRHRVQTGQLTVMADDDPDYTDLSKIAAAWNRASKVARQSFLDLAQEAELGIIDP